MDVITKLWKADAQRRTRLHDQSGNMVPVSRLLKNGPRAFVTGLGRLAFGFRPKRPWISYDAQSRLKRFVHGKTVVEYGSGMSTLWFAKHAKYVLSLEDNEEWYTHLKETLRFCYNVGYSYVPTRDAYLRIAAHFASQGDLILIDGDHHRAECVGIAVSAIRPGGIIYLDNSDFDSFGDAHRLLSAFARRTGAKIEYFTDFAPAQFTPNQGMLVLTR